MRILLTLIALIFAFIANSQEWKKSLLDARKFYKNGQYPEAVQNYQKAIKMGENGYCEVNKNYSSSMMAENILSYYSVVISNKNYKNY